MHQLATHRYREDRDRVVVVGKPTTVGTHAVHVGEEGETNVFAQNLTRRSSAYGA
jgi:hypothetical protein